MTPNLEGLLIRLHAGHETRSITASHTGRQLRTMWLDYDKGSLRAEQLKRRFSVTDLKRVARFDEGLRKLLETLGL